MTTEPEDKPRAKVYTFKLLLRQLTAMQAVQQQTGATVAEQIRRGIDLWLKQQEAGR